MLFIQVVGLLVLETSHQVYQNLDWYGNIAFFLLDDQLYHF